MKKIYFAAEAVDIDHASFFLVDQRGGIVAAQKAIFSPRSMKLLWRIAKFLKENKLGFSDISGIITVSGPGSFTSIRTVLSVINTWANIAGIPAVGVSRNDFSSYQDLIVKGLKMFQKRKKLSLITPFYGSLPRITAPGSRG